MTSLTPLSFKFSLNAAGQERRPTLPNGMIGVVIVVCILPFLLNVLGIGFGSPSHPFDVAAAATLSSQALTDTLHRTLAGSYTHTILEWSAFCTASFTVILAFAHFKIKHDVTTPILGIALLCAGVMDAFHTLAADRLIDTAAANQNLIPFTWALCRLFNALISMIGVSIFLVIDTTKIWRRGSMAVGCISAAFMGIAYITIQVCARSEHLPQTLYPDAIITRPWDVIPLVLFIIGGIWLYPRFYRKHPTLFSHALVISAIPNVVTQAHMAFGSSALFDNDFNIAHFLKIVAYVVPLGGLVLDYIYTHHALERRNTEFLLEIQERRETEAQLQSTLEELKAAQVQLIQTEKMSSLGQMVSGVAHEINNPVNFIHGNLDYLRQDSNNLLELVKLYQATYPQSTPMITAKLEDLDFDFLQNDLPNLLQSMAVGTERIRTIVKSLRTFSRLDEADCKAADLHQGLDSTLLILQHRLQGHGQHSGITVIRHYGDIPLVQCYAGQLNQVFMNAIVNALDAMEERDQHRAAAECQRDPSTLTIRTQRSPDGHQVTIVIADNGPGMPQAVQQKVFDPFFTTKPVGKGTGLGMSISHQIIAEHHNGSINYCSHLGQGTELHITIPVSQPESKP